MLSYITLRDPKVKQSVYPVEQFHLHSLQAGSALLTASADVPDHLFKWHHRWKSKNRYVENFMEKWLSVTKSIGL